MKLNRFNYLMAQGVKNIFTHGFMSFASITIIIACLLIMGSFSLLTLNIDANIDRLQNQNEVIAYVDETLTRMRPGPCSRIKTLRRKGENLEMLETAGAMFEKAMDAFIARNVELARQVCGMDDQVDAMFSKIVLEVCGTITENPQSVMKEVDLMFITKYIERMGDHATNIAEWVVYMETGVHPDLKRWKDLEARRKPICQI